MKITDRKILRIALPIVFSNVTIPLLGLVDSAVVGQIPSPIPLGAVAIGSLIATTIYWFFGFLRMGTTGIASQAWGAKKNIEAETILARVLLIGAVAGAFLIFLQKPIFVAAFHISPASVPVEELALQYLKIRIFSAPAAIAFLGLTGWLIATERTREVLFLQIWINGLNILLDLWFVLGLGWGVSGVAVATALAEISGMFWGLFICRHTLGAIFKRSFALVFDRAPILRMIKISRDILVRTLMLQVIFISFTFIGASFGDVHLAANQVLLQFLVFSAFILDGLAFAVETLVGKAFGARDIEAFRDSVRKSTKWGLLFVFGITSIFFLKGEWIISIITKSLEVQLAANQYLPYLICAPLLSFAAYMLDGIFLGATQTAAMRNMMALSVLCYLAAAGLLIPFFQNHGLWLALLISFVARGLTLAIKYPDLEKGLINQRSI